MEDLASNIMRRKSALQTFTIDHIRATALIDVGHIFNLNMISSRKKS